jgi:hypothetical protein
MPETAERAERALDTLLLGSHPKVRDSDRF